jgi:hypothetical protein
MADLRDCIALLKLISGANPSAKFNANTPQVWASAFHDVHRLKLFIAVDEYIKHGSKFTPAVSEIYELIRQFDFRQGWWRPPEMPEDEKCMWFMEINNITDPFDLTEEQVRAIYGPIPFEETEEGIRAKYGTKERLPA